MKPGDAFNLFLAQIELRNDLPFTITTDPKRLLSTAEQGKVWEDALGEY
jgi:antitoxin component of RelBE/YafQ-DinJ toxin-antitoxin module